MNGFTIFVHSQLSFVHSQLITFVLSQIGKQEDQHVQYSMAINEFGHIRSRKTTKMEPGSLTEEQ